MKTLEFSDDELSALVQLIDIAIKSQGLGVAEAAVVLVNKIKAAAGPPQEVDPNPQFASSIEPAEEAEVVEE
tara:strand:- start:45 stop:260 length:216 start_codon:yes stop_codon:yes gene_type:complete